MFLQGAHPSRGRGDGTEAPATAARRPRHRPHFGGRRAAAATTAAATPAAATATGAAAAATAADDVRPLRQDLGRGDTNCQVQCLMIHILGD